MFEGEMSKVGWLSYVAHVPCEATKTVAEAAKGG